MQLAGGAVQLVGLVEANAARPRHQPRHGGGRTRAQSMLSAATKSSHQEGALGAMAATIARYNSDARIAALTATQDRSATSEISWSYLAKANCIFD